MVVLIKSIKSFFEKLKQFLHVHYPDYLVLDDFGLA